MSDYDICHQCDEALAVMRSGLCVPCWEAERAKAHADDIALDELRKLGVRILDRAGGSSDGLSHAAVTAPAPQPGSEAIGPDRGV